MHAAYAYEHVFAGTAAVPMNCVDTTPRLAGIPSRHTPLQERLDCSTEHWYGCQILLNMLISCGSFESTPIERRC